MNDTRARELEHHLFSLALPHTLYSPTTFRRVATILTDITISPSMSLPSRTLGKDGPKVTALGFGLMALSGAYGLQDSEEVRMSLLDKLLELGETFWDSADIYGDSEDLMGWWFTKTGNRDKVFLATKFGLTPQGVRSDPEYVKSACEKSLKRLACEWIDLYYCHRVDGKTPIEKTVEAMVELKKYALSQNRKISRRRG